MTYTLIFAALVILSVTFAVLKGRGRRLERQPVVALNLIEGRREIDSRR